MTSPRRFDDFPAPGRRPRKCPCGKPNAGAVLLRLEALPKRRLVGSLMRSLCEEHAVELFDRLTAEIIEWTER